MIRKVLEIKKHAGAIYSGVFFEDSLITASADRYVVAWDHKTGEQLPFVIKNDASSYIIEKLNNQFLLIGSSNGSFHIIDYHKKKELKNYQQHRSAIFSIEINPFQNQIYLGDADGNISVWDSITFKLLLFLPLNIGKIRVIKTINNGDTIAIGAQDGYIRLFDTTNFNELNTNFIHSGGITSVLPLENGIVLTGGKDAYLRVLDNNLKVLKAIPAHNFAIYDLQLFKQLNTIVSVSRDKSIKLWNANDLNFLGKITFKEGGHQHSVNKIIPMKQNQFATVSDDKRTIIWSFEDFKV